MFRQATTGLPRRYAKEMAAGMSDTALGEALKQVLGIFGGSGGPERLSITYQGAGLKIWGSWHVHNHVTERPLFEGQATIRMARYLYHISDPTETQLSLL
ncbi:MAG: hypothetical protein JKY94_08725 [Rhodobacteraceae bacterium]|nr:hypothetical protein [Paracoccaceae bacterium]